VSDPELLAVVRQAQRYDIAAAQDRSPVIASLHLAYARQAMEFALEAQQLLGITLEGSVG